MSSPYAFARKEMVGEREREMRGARGQVRVAGKANI